MTLSVVIPAHNEEGAIGATVEALATTLTAAGVPHEILVVVDHSTDGTIAALHKAAVKAPALRWITNDGPAGYGFAVRAGLEAFRGDAVCIVMADASDDPADVVKYYRKLEEGYECAFGSRFTRGAVVTNYPWQKLILNRLGNTMLSALFGVRYNDLTNAFKCFRREVIEGLRPILACHFNLTVELPLKAIVRGYSYAIVPTHWYGREHGVSKFRIKEMGGRYMFIVLYVLLEKWLTQGDYHRRGTGLERVDRPLGPPSAGRGGASVPPVPPTEAPASRDATDVDPASHLTEQGRGAR